MSTADSSSMAASQLIHNGQNAGTSRRRPHSKSRTGCKPCKRGRIKCDEKHPHCTNCMKRQTTCEYFELRCRPKGGLETRAIRPRSPRPATLAPTPMSNAALSAHTIFSGRIQTPTGRLLERQLFHHYLEMTTRSKGTHFDWSFWTVQQAGQSQCVMDALLGLAAFHLRHFHDNEALGQASYQYMARAINAHRQELDVGLNKHNASSIAAACALISIHAAVSQNYIGTKDNAQMTHFWFLPLQRGLELLRLTTPLIRMPSNPDNLGLETTTQISQQARHSNPFSFLLFYSADPDASQDDVSAYTAAVAHLSYIYADIQHRRPLHFAIMASTHFVDLVAANDPRALAITGYFFMVIKKGSPSWWFDRLPERGFATVMELLPPAWWSVMDWAIREFAWNVVEKNKGLGRSLDPLLETSCLEAPAQFSLSDKDATGGIEMVGLLPLEGQ